MFGFLICDFCWNENEPTNSQPLLSANTNNRNIGLILKKLASSKKSNQTFPLQLETVDPEFLLYKKFKGMKFDIKNNNIPK